MPLYLHLRLHILLLLALGASSSSPPDQHPLHNPSTHLSTGPCPLSLAILTNFPDPSIYFDPTSNMWYVMATNYRAGILASTASNSSDAPSLSTKPVANVQIARSPDFRQWSLLAASHDPLPTPGAWAKQDSTIIAVANVWAPDFVQHPLRPHHWILYYSAVSAAHPGQHCLGAAISACDLQTSSSPSSSSSSKPDAPDSLDFFPPVVGPYEALPTPLACAVGQGGAIDATAFVDWPDSSANGLATGESGDNSTPDIPALYVAYKIDGNNAGHGGECGNTVPPIHSTPIMLQRMLLSDGATPDPSFAPVQILDRTADDGPLVEAPALVKVRGLYFLFYSSGCTQNPDYDVKYAFARNVTGPYTRVRGKIVQTGDWGLEAPGSVSVKRAQGNERRQGSVVEGEDGWVYVEDDWRIALHARVQTNWGRVRAMFTGGLRFAIFDNGREPLVELIKPRLLW